MGTGKAEEYARHTVEQQSALFVGQNGVGKGWLLLIVDDAFDFLPLLFYTLFQGRKVVVFLNQLEVGSAERQRATGKQWVGTCAFGRCGCRQQYRRGQPRSEEHTSELQSRQYLVCR